MRARPAVQRLSAYPLSGTTRRGKIRLDLNESTHGCPPGVLEALRQIAWDDVAAYPEYGDLLQRLAAHHGVAPGQMLLTNGADDGLRSVMQAFIDPGDRVVMTEPSFGIICLYAEGMGALVEAVPYGEDLAYPVTAMLDRMTPPPRLVAVVRPDSPTGSLIERADLGQLLAASPDTLVMLDETYHHFSGDSCLDLLGEFPNLLVLHSFSKAWGLAGLRLGVIFAAPGLIAELRKVVPPFSASAVAVVAAHAALEDPSFVAGVVASVRREKRYLIKQLRALDLTVRDTAANFVLVRVGERVPAIQQQLSERDILVKSLHAHPLLEGYLRVAVGTRPELDAFLTALEEILAAPVTTMEEMHQ